MAKELANFSFLCRKIGCKADQVQAGGGNISVKLDGEIMLIKASGFPLRIVNSDHGSVRVDYEKIQSFFNRPEKVSEAECNDFIASTSISDITLRPSIETGFHAFLGRYVLHTHSIRANSLLCSSVDDTKIEKLFAEWSPPVMLVPYLNPGYQLSSSLYTKTNEYRQRNGRGPEVILLRNHGVIVTHDEYEAALLLLEQIDSVVSQYSDQSSWQMLSESISGRGKAEGEIEDGRDSFVNLVMASLIARAWWFEGFIFPDQIVYCDVPVVILPKNQEPGAGVIDREISVTDSRIIYKKFKKENEVREVFEAVLAILWLIEQNGILPQFISPSDVDYIRSMESERYRQNLKFT